MNLYLAKYSKKIILSIFMLISFQAHASEFNALIPDDTHTENQEHLYSKLHEAFIDLLDKIDAIFDTISQAYSHGAIGKQLKKSEKKQIDNLLFELRKTVSLLKQNSSFFQNKYHSTAIASEISELVNILQFISNQGLVKLIKHKKKLTHYRSVIITESNFENITPQQLNILINEINYELFNIAKKSETLGLSKVNQIYRSSRKAWKKYYISEALERIAVYGAFSLWLTYISSKGAIESLSKKVPLLGEPWLRFKKSIGSPKIPNGAVQHEVHAPLGILNPDGSVNLISNLNTVNVIDANNVKLNNNNNIAEINLAGLKPIIIDKSKIDHVENPLMVTYQGASENGGCSGGETTFNKALEATTSLVKFGTEAFIHLQIGKVFSEYFLKDFNILKNKINRALGVIDDKLYGLVKQRTFTEIIVGTDLTFKDIIGRDYIKSELAKIIDYVVNPSKYDRNNITVEKGILFFGSSQNGKSLMVKAFANELTNALAKAGQANQVRLVTISVKDIIARGGISEFVAVAESFGMPVILVIDEIDMLCLQRDRDTKMLADVLTSMSSGLSASEKNMVIIIGLTNKPSNIDTALIQHGRFGKHLEFSKPTFNDRYQFFERELQRCFLDLDNFNCKKLAHETEGTSFGTLLAVSKRAFFNAKQSGTAVTQAHFEKAIDTEVKNIIYTGEDISSEKEHIIAVQQAGKALISMLLKPSKQLCKVTILPYVQHIEEEHVHQNYNWSQSQIDKNKKSEELIMKHGGIFAYNLSDEPLGTSIQDLEKEAKILLAGDIAQKIIPNSSRYINKEDKELAFGLIRTIMTEGEDTILRNLPKEVSQTLLTKAYSRMKDYEKEVEKLLTEHQDILKEMVEKLKQYKEINSEEIALLQNKLDNKSLQSSK